MKLWENKEASKQKNDTITVNKNTSTPTGSGSTAPSWFKTSEAAYAKRYSDAPAVTGGGSGRSVNIGGQRYGYDTTPIMTAAQMSELMGGYNYDEGAIRALFDRATKAEYAAKRAANAGAQRQFATNTGEYITTLSDTMRQQLNQAVATGGSRGLAAAQAMQAAQDASLKTVDEATKLTEDAMALDFEEAAAYAQNARDAEALRATRQQNMMNLSAQLRGFDVQEAVGAMGAAAQYYAGRDYGLGAADKNLQGTIYNADKNFETEQLIAQIQSDDNAKGLIANLISSGVLSGSPEIARLLGLPESTVFQAPIRNGYSGGYNGYYGDKLTGPETERDNIDTTDQAWNDYNKYLMAENKGKATGSINGLSGWDDPKAQEKYVNDKALIRSKAEEKNITFVEYKTWIKQTYGGTDADAMKFWNGYNPRAKKNLQYINNARTGADLTGGDTNEMLKQAKQAFSFDSYAQWLYDNWGYSSQVANRIWQLIGRSSALNITPTISAKK